MKSLFRYMTRQVGLVVLVVTCGLSLAIWLTQSLRFVELIVDRGLPLGVFLHLTLLMLPAFLTIILPIALFAGILFVYNKLTMDSEMVVMRAAGVSQLGLAAPALSVALAVVVAVVSLNLYFLPMSHRAFKDLQFSIRNDVSAVLLREGTFNQLGERLTVYIRERGPNDELFGILVHDARVPEQPVTMMAERGALVRSPDGARVVMFSGNRQEREGTRGRLSLLYFDSYSLDLDAFQQANEVRWREPRERYLHELFNPGDSPDDRYYAERMWVEGHRRLASPLLGGAFALVALGALLSGNFNRRGQAQRIGVALVVGIGLQAGAVGLDNVAVRTPAMVPLLYLLPVVVMLSGLWWMVRRPRRPAPGPPMATA